MILKNGKEITSPAIDATPIGILQPFVSDVAPLGYLPCIGQLVSKETYAELYDLCGNKFGTATATDFYLPDLREKTIVGYKTGSTEFPNIGSLYGEKQHTLTVPEMPTHTHPQIFDGSAGGQWGILGKVNTAYSYGGTDRFIGNAGGDQSHNNIQPSIGMNWIVKALKLYDGNNIIVVNNLTSTSATDALSANQGKVLNDTKIDKDSINNTLTSTSITEVLSANMGKQLNELKINTSSQLEKLKEPYTITDYNTFNPSTLGLIDGGIMSVKATSTANFVTVNSSSGIIIAMTTANSYTLILQRSGVTDKALYMRSWYNGVWGAWQNIGEGGGTEVINNLTSTSTTSALSANMGKRLNDTKAPTSSPGFTGTPTAPTASTGTNNTQIATTAFVNNEISNDALLKTGGTMGATAQIQTTGRSQSWYNGRDGALTRVNSYTGYNPISSMKTTNGSWEMGVYSDNVMNMSYVTDADYSARTNRFTAQIRVEKNGALFKGSGDKNVPTVFMQSSTPTAVQAGDIWVT